MHIFRLHNRRRALTLVGAVLIALLALMAVTPEAASAEQDNRFLQPVAKEDEVPDGWTPIYTAADLNKLRDDYRGKYILMADIDAASLGEWLPVGDPDYYNEFSGTLDGNGHTISNLTTRVVNDGEKSSGLFYILGRYAEVYDLGLIDCSPSYSGLGNLTFGPLASSGKATVRNCWAQLDLSIRQDMRFSDGESQEPSDRAIRVGGLIGSDFATFDYCYVDGSISIESEVFLDGPAGLSADFNGDDPGPIIQVGGFSSNCASSISHSLNSCDISVVTSASNSNYESGRNDGVDGTVNVYGLWANNVSECKNEGAITVRSEGTYAGEDGFAVADFYIAGIRGDLRNCINAGDIACEANYYGPNSGSPMVEIYGITSAYNYIDVQKNFLNMGDVLFSTNTAPQFSGSVGGAYLAGFVGGSSDEELLDTNQGCYVWSDARVDSPLMEYRPTSDKVELISPIISILPKLNTKELGSNSSYQGWDFESIWAIAEDGVAHPELRCLSGFSESEPIEPTIDVLDADDPFAQLVACELASFNLTESDVGLTVEGYISSDSFKGKDSCIWSDEGWRYSDLFRETIGEYEIVSARRASADGHLALRHPNSGATLIVLNPNDFSTYLDVGKTITTGSAKEAFDSAALVYEEVRRLYPTDSLYLTGSYLGGMTAAYMSAATGLPATVFDAWSGFGIQLAMASQASVTDAGYFAGVDKPICTSIYPEQLEAFFGYGKELSNACAAITNPSASAFDLNALYEHAGTKFQIANYGTYKPSQQVEQYYVSEVSDIIKSAVNTVNGFENGEIDLSFASKTNRLVMGTTMRDSVLSGALNDWPFNLVIPQIMYTGSGDDGLFKGGGDSDVFVAGRGRSTIAGGGGSDVYVVGDSTNVTIKDSSATNENVLSKGMIGVLKCVVAGPSAGKNEIWEALVSLIKDNEQDTVIFNDCSLDDMSVTLEKASSPFGSDFYVIHAGSSVVRIQRRLFFERDFKIVDASGEGGTLRSMDLEDLYERDNRTASIGLMSGGLASSDTIVEFSAFGPDSIIEVSESETGEVLFTVDASKGESFSHFGGNFFVDSDSQLISACYDASLLDCRIVSGDIDRVVINRTSDSVGTDILYADDLSLGEGKIARIVQGEFNSVVIEEEDGSSTAMEMVEVSDGESVDEPDVPSTPPGSSGGSVFPEPSFEPEIVKTSHGTVTVNPEKPHEGDRVTVVLEPDQGYVTENIAITDANGNAVDIERISDDAWTFEQPKGSVRIAVKFVCDGGDGCPSGVFLDVDQSQWYHGAIDWSLQVGAFHGYDDGTFGPNDRLLREQAASVLWNLLGDEGVIYPATDKADVEQGQWYSDGVNWAVSCGVMNGYDGSRLFGIGDALTREQFAGIIANACEVDLGRIDLSLLNSFSDSSEVSEWAKRAVAWAVQEGVIHGVEIEDGSRELQAEREISRAEMAAMMMNAVERGVLKGL